MTFLFSDSALRSQPYGVVSNNPAEEREEGPRFSLFLSNSNSYVQSRGHIKPDLRCLCCLLHRQCVISIPRPTRTLTGIVVRTRRPPGSHKQIAFVGDGRPSVSPVKETAGALNAKFTAASSTALSAFVLSVISFGDFPTRAASAR